MKKTLLVSMMFVLAFSFAGSVIAQEEASESVLTQEVPVLTQAPVLSQDEEAGLKKIPSPDQIKNFQNIKRVGNSLFGFLRAEKDLKKDKKDKKDKSEGDSKSTSTLEKISHPAEISFFEKIKKIGSALWGFRKNEPKKPVLVKPEAVQCVKDAIDKKDAAIKASRASSSASVIAAIDVRNSCQKAALDKTIAKEQFEANKACADAFQKTVKDINVLAEKDRSALWGAFNVDLKACSAKQKTDTATGTVESLNDEIKIDDGGSSVAPLL